jgi:hypothetical protein
VDALPAGPETYTVKRCQPRLRPFTVQGELHENCGALSSEQRVLVTVPVVVQANVFVVPKPVCDVKRTVGAVGAGADEVTDHVAVALALPLLFETVTRKVWLPSASPEYDFGDVQATAEPPSSEHEVLVTVPVVDHVKEAFVDVVDEAGPPVSDTVGAEPGGVPVPESTWVPNSCDQYTTPEAFVAAPTPVERYEPFSMFAR